MARIIAGSAGGRRLSTPPGDSTRPTTDRVREAFFSSLAAWVGSSEQPATTQLDAISFLDLFAGSGAVGLEAASRGASPVVLVEKAEPVVRLVRDNARAAGLQVQVHRAGAEQFLAGPAQPFDVVWFDPPYAVPDDVIDQMVAQVVDGGWLAADALVVVERSSRSRTPRWPGGPDAWERRYGETTLHHAQY